MFADFWHSRCAIFCLPAFSARHAKKVNRDCKLSRCKAASSISLLTVFFLASLGTIAAKSNLGPVHGFILNGQGRPVAHATVEVRDLHGSKIASAVSDSAGAFTFALVGEPGEYVFLAADDLWVTEQQIALDANPREVDSTLPVSPERSPIVAHRAIWTVSAQQLRVPKQARQYLKLAQNEFRRSNIEKAEGEIDRAIQSDSSFAAAFSMRAFLRLASRAFAEAIADAQHALSLEPSDADAYLALGTAYNSVGEFSRAEQALRQALELRPHLWQAELEMAKAYYGQGRFVVALYALDGLGNDFPDVHLVRANVLERLGRSTEAASEFQRFLQEEPHDLRSEQVRRIVAATDPVLPSSSFLHP
jgi:tetratricopeptide (TPR) repeat protein